jgi:hypothetical protein
MRGSASVGLDAAALKLGMFSMALREASLRAVVAVAAVLSACCSSSLFHFLDALVCRCRTKTNGRWWKGRG